MNTYELWAIVISLVSVIVAIISFVMACVSNFKAGKLQQGQVELDISKYITDTKNEVVKLSLKMAEGNNICDNDIFKQTLKAAMENNFNAYEEACSKYIDGKIDKVRFTKTYKSEIRNLVEMPEYKDYFNAVTSKYKAILKVYDEWENLEK